MFGARAVEKARCRQADPAPGADAGECFMKAGLALRQADDRLDEHIDAIVPHRMADKIADFLVVIGGGIGIHFLVQRVHRRGPQGRRQHFQLEHMSIMQAADFRTRALAHSAETLHDRIDHPRFS